MLTDKLREGFRGRPQIGGKDIEDDKEMGNGHGEFDTEKGHTGGGNRQNECEGYGGGEGGIRDPVNGTARYDAAEIGKAQKIEDDHKASHGPKASLDA